MITKTTLNDVASALSIAQKAEELGLDNIIHDLTYALANIFAKDNPRFDRERFYRAASTKKGN